MQPLIVLLARILLSRLALTTRPARGHGGRDECGDVPGWVLVTVMTAGLVMVIWGVADDQLSNLLSSALASVGRP